MLDLLRLSIGHAGPLALEACGRPATALVLGLAVAGIWRWARRGEAFAPSFPAALVLLATVVAIATQLAGAGLTNAFGVAGALALVSFRTDTDLQDTTFLLFSAVVGMAAGTGSSSIALGGLVVVGLAAPVLWPRRRHPRPRSIGPLGGGAEQADARTRTRLASRPLKVSARKAPRPPRRASPSKPRGIKPCCPRPRIAIGNGSRGD